MHLFSRNNFCSRSPCRDRGMSYRSMITYHIQSRIELLHELHASSTGTYLEPLYTPEPPQVSLAVLCPFFTIGKSVSLTCLSWGSEGLQTCASWLTCDDRLSLALWHASFTSPSISSFNLSEERIKYVYWSRHSLPLCFPDSFQGER